MDELLKIALVVCPFVFVAGFVDSVAGGGGIISMPAYFIVGVPPHIAVGTNKFVATFGTALAAAEYMAKGKILYKIALVSAAGAVAGSFIGTNIALALSPNVLKYLIVFLLPVLAVFLTVNKNFEVTIQSRRTFSPAVTLLLSFCHRPCRRMLRRGDRPRHRHFPYALLFRYTGHQLTHLFRVCKALQFGIQSNIHDFIHNQRKSPLCCGTSRRGFWHFREFLGRATL